MKTIEERVKAILATQSGYDLDYIKPEQNLISDLYFDSLDFIECVMVLEDEFGLVIPDEAEDKLQTVQQIIDYVTANIPVKVA